MALIFNPFDGHLAQHPDYSAEFEKLNKIYFSPTTVKNSNYSAALREEVRCNTTAGSFTVTLPAMTAENQGESIKIVDFVGIDALTGFGQNPLTVVGSSGATIMNSADLSIDIGSTRLTLTYNHSDTDWKISDVDSPMYNNLDWSSILNKPTYATTSSIELELTGSDGNYAVEGNLVDKGVLLQNLSDSLQTSIGLANTAVQPEEVDPLLNTLAPAGGLDTFITVPLGLYETIAYTDDGLALLGQYWPYDFILTDVELTLKQAATGSNFIVDILRNEESIFSTDNHLTLTSGSATNSSYTFNTNFTDDFRLFREGDVVKFKIEQVGSTVPGSYPVVTLKGIRGDSQALVVPLSFTDFRAELSEDLALVGGSFPIDFQVEKIILTVQSPPTGSSLIVDIKKGTGGATPTSIFNTNLLQVASGDSTSIPTPYSLTTTPLIINKEDLLTFSVTQIGSTDPSVYPVVTFIGREI